MAVRIAIKKLLAAIAGADGPSTAADIDRAASIVERSAAVNAAIEAAGGTPVGALATVALLAAFIPGWPIDFDVMPALAAAAAADAAQIRADDQVSGIVLAALTTARYRPHRAMKVGAALQCVADAAGQVPARLAAALVAVRRACDQCSDGVEADVVGALGLETSHPLAYDRVCAVWGSDTCEDELDHVPGDIALDWALALGASNECLVGYLAWGAVADAGRSAAGHRLAAALIMAGYVSANLDCDVGRREARAAVTDALAPRCGLPQPAEFEDALWALAGKITDTLIVVTVLPPIIL